MPSGARFRAQPGADQGNRLAGIGDLPAHHHHQREAEQQEEQAGHGVLDADYLVIDREDVGLPEAELVMLVLTVPVCGVVSFAPACRGGGGFRRRHVSQRRDSFRTASCLSGPLVRWKSRRRRSSRPMPEGPSLSRAALNHTARANSIRPRPLDATALPAVGNDAPATCYTRGSRRRNGAPRTRRRPPR